MVKSEIAKCIQKHLKYKLSRLFLSAVVFLVLFKSRLLSFYNYLLSNRANNNI